MKVDVRVVVNVRESILLVIIDEMLGSSNNTLRVNTVDIDCGQLGRQHRVLP